MLKPEEILEPTDVDIGNEGFSLILFNDSHHDFDEVVMQVMKATGYGYDKAEAITLEAHNKGRATVIAGTLDKCLKVQTILEEIGLRTSIEVNV
jgi:ATP-dependent Clp protease adaptor protein ClpS